jgi:hypothetical protein
LLVNIKARVKALVKARPGDKGLARLFPGECAVTQPQSARLQRAQSARHAAFLSVAPARYRLAAFTRSSTTKQQFALAGVARERCRALELAAGFVEAAEFFQEVAAHARQKVVAPE